MKPFLFAIVVLGLCGGCNDSSTSKSNATNTRSSTTSSATTASSPVNRDNTEVNERDRDSTAITPIDQKENKEDRDISAKIRREVVATKMSVNAQNVKIITQDGKVTLRGPVKSDEEKKRIEEIALSVAGAGNVDSHLEVEAR